MAGSVYGQNPPLANPGRGLGRWNTYDIVFRAPVFDGGGAVVRPADVTVLFNGVLVQDHWTFEGRTMHKLRPAYAAHPEKVGLSLQDHGDVVHYRNIWVRELPPRPVSAFSSNYEARP